MNAAFYGNSPNADAEKRSRELVERRAYEYSKTKFLGRRIAEMRLDRAIARLGKVRSKLAKIERVGGYS